VSGPEPRFVRCTGRAGGSVLFEPGVSLTRIRFAERVIVRGRTDSNEVYDVSVDEQVALLVVDHLAPVEVALERDGRLSIPEAVDLVLRVIEDLGARRPVSSGGQERHGTEAHTLGSVLYLLLSGRWPFAGHSFEQLGRRVLNGEVDPLRRFATDVPTELAAAIHRAIRHEPEARFGTVAAFGAAIAPFSSTHSPRAAAFTELLRPTDPAPAEIALKSRGMPRAVLVRSALLGTAAGLSLALFTVAGVLVLSNRSRTPAASREAPPLFHVELDVAPADAEIALDGVVRGKGRLSTDLVIDHRSHRVRITMPGYETVEIPFKDRAPPADIALFRSLVPSRTATRGGR
jgi:hypothetical protein